MPVHDSAAREDHDVVLLAASNGQTSPVHQVPADRVSPTHMSPFVCERVVLIEQMIFALVIDRAVGVVHPVLGGSEMKLRTIELPISLRRFVASSIPAAE